MTTPKRKTGPIHMLLMAFAVLLAGAACTPTDLPGSAGAQEVWVSMPDGIHLATTLCLPAGEGSWPAVLIRTPYGRDEERNWGPALTEVGIAFVVQDARGRFDSEGEGVSFFADRTDGQATLAWIAAQPFVTSPPLQLRPHVHLTTEAVVLHVCTASAPTPWPSGSCGCV